MKTNLLNTEKKMLRLVAFFMLAASPSLMQAQSGANDASFNKPDKIAAQGTNGIVNYSAIQPDNKLIITGNFSKYNGADTKGIVRLNIDGKRDKSFNPSVNGEYRSVAVQPNSKILVAGNFPTIGGSEKLIRLNAGGSKDNTFQAELDSLSSIIQVIVQPNEKILLIGYYSAPGQFTKSRILRLNKNGSVDNSFQPVITDSISLLQRMALQPDGKILIASYVGIEWSMSSYFSAIRLNTDGSRDYSYKLSPAIASDSYPFINDIKVESDGGVLIGVAFDNASILQYNGILTRFNSHGEFVETIGLFWINSLQLQSDGKIIVAGTKNLGDETGKTEVRRLNKDLTQDASFVFDEGKTYATVNESEIKTAALQLDGKLLIAGDFTEVDGLIGNNVTRLNTNGSVDLTFNQRKGSDGSILASAVQANGRIIIAGQFERFNYQPARNIARLKVNGDFDPSFVTGSGTNGKVNAVAIQSNGKILIGGKFTSYNGHACNNIVRLNTDGSVDPSFSTGTDNTVRKIKVDNSGKIVIAGDFKTVNGVSKIAVARLHKNGSLDAAFTTSIAIPVKGGVYDFVFSSTGQIYVAVNYKDNADGIYYAPELIRLNTDGTTDAAFNFTDDSFYEFHSLALNNDGKLIAGGEPLYPLYHHRGKIEQYNTDGTLDPNFSGILLADSLSGSVRTINVLPNNNIIIGGDFNNHIELLTAYGTVVEEFTVTAGNSIYTATLAGPELIIGGTFSEYAGVVRNSIARIDVATTESARTAQAISDKLQDVQLSVYPNPAVSDIRVEGLKAGSVLKIFNAIGKEMHSEVVNNERELINVSAYSNGVYFMIVDNGENRSTTKIIVNK